MGTVTMAVPLLDGSATDVAVTVIDWAEAVAAGAVNSPAGLIVPAEQVQVTPCDGEPVPATLAAKACR